MKLTDLFLSARRRSHHAGEIEASARLGSHVGNRMGNELTDRSSMADLVRLLKEADDTQTGSGRQPI